VKSGRRPVSSPPAGFASDPISLVFAAPCVVVCLIPFVIAFFPDERLVRLKLLGLELAVFSLFALVGATFFFDADSRRIRGLFKAALVSGLFVAVQSALWRMTPEKSLATVEMRRVMLVAASFLACASMEFSPVWRRRLLGTWALCAGLTALYGILQRTGGMGDLLVPFFARPPGTFGNPIFFAAFLLASLFVAVQCSVDAVKFFARCSAAAIAAVILVALVLTQTRAAWIGLAIAAALGTWMAMPRKQGKIIGLLGLLIVGGGFAVATRSIWSRDQAHALIWRDTLSMWESRPVTGVGIGTFHIHFPDYARPDLKAKWPEGTFIMNDAHNEYLQELAEGGVIGFLSWLLIPGFFVVALLRRADVRRRDAWLIAGIAGVAAQNFFSVDMRFGVSASMAALLMGLVVGSVRHPGMLSAGITADNRIDAVNKRDSGLRHAGMTDMRRVLLAVLWIASLCLLTLPRLLQPYRAQQFVQAAPAFFDQRVLDPAQTIQDLEALTGKYPSEPSVWEKLGFVYAKQIQRPDKRLDLTMANHAIAAYERALALDPPRVSATNNLANIHYTIGQVDQAMTLWRQAIQEDPHSVDARLNLGKILYAQGRLKDAAEQFDVVLKEDPGNAEAIVYLKRMVE
jgi:O-antigen ligase/cytochrome c-type biogenesis protein CcmH/NrfG